MALTVTQKFSLLLEIAPVVAQRASVLFNEAAKKYEPSGKLNLNLLSCTIVDAQREAEFRELSMMPENQIWKEGARPRIGKIKPELTEQYKDAWLNASAEASTHDEAVEALFAMTTRAGTYVQIAGEGDGGEWGSRFTTYDYLTFDAANTEWVRHKTTPQFKAPVPKSPVG